MSLQKVVLGGSFRTVWINSGSTPSLITYNILSGSETLVSSYAGVDSGNGHYYVDAYINPNTYAPGIYQGVWLAVLNVNTYRNVEYLHAYPEQSDQPGRYITWDSVVERYADFPSAGGAVKAASHYVSLAEARIDARLASHFTVPFSNNNTTVRDLAIDMTYLLAARISKEEYDRIKALIDETIEGLKNGSIVMITDSGAVSAVLGDKTVAWSSQEDHHPAFSMLDPLSWGVGSQELIDAVNERG